MEPKKIAMVVVAAALIVVAVVLMVRQMGPSPEQQDPMAAWICDNCGDKATVPLENVSVDCAKCDTGQMVQRVYFKCKRCGELFEGYQLNWSPTAARAEVKCKEADRQGALPEGIPEDQALLVRRRGGKWAWADAPAGRKMMTELSCPKCGKAKLGQFTKILNPAEQPPD